MKIFFSEFSANYEKYRFPYQIWLLKEEGDDIEKIYSSGFLPIRSIAGAFYLSRNIRVQLEKFELSSENRRVLEKTKRFKLKLVPKSDFTYTPKIQKFCKDYCDERFGKGFLSTAAIKAIFNSPNFNYVFLFEDSESRKLAGLAVCFVSSKVVQYAHSFYDPQFLKENLGASMMVQVISWAKDNKKDYVYLGTCYEEKSLYKTEFKGTEFFNGFRWSDNLEELKSLIRKEGEDGEYLLKDKEYLEKFYRQDLSSILNNFGIRVSF